MVGSVSSVARSPAPQPIRDDAPPVSRHTVRPGDTMWQIARANGVSLQALEDANPHIRNPSLIFPGDVVNLPGGPRVHTVRQGDTMSAIARGNGVSLDALAVANPQVANIDRIYPGDRIAIPTAPQQPPAADPRPAPAPAPTPTPSLAPTAPVAAPGLADGTLTLSAQDVVDIKKTLQTEWVQSAGEDQAMGIVDTILNRQASGRWGSTVADVVNAPQQFSAINGPPARAEGRDSVDDLPLSSVSTSVDRFVDRYLANRAAGTPSRVGDHLNYANPNFSSASNLGWIRALDGPVLGSGQAVHHHGTVPELNGYRPGAFGIRQPE